MGPLLARAYKRILSGKLAQDAGEHWVTVNAGSKEGGEGGGSHVLLDGEGRVVAGMGGKFKGQNIDRIERKKFINQNAWNRQRKALTEKAGSEASKRISQTAVSSIMTPESSTEQDRSVAQSHLAELLKRSKADTSEQGLINKLHTGIETEQAEKQASEEPKADRKSLIDQVNARHTMPMGDIIARKEQATPKTEEVQAEAPKAETKGGNALLDSAGRRDQHEAAYKERAKIVKELRKLNVSNPGEDLTFSKYGRTFTRIPDPDGVSKRWREVGRKGEPYKPEYTHEQGRFSNEKEQQYKEWHDRREQWIRDAGLDPIKDRPQYFYDKATNTESFRQIYDPNDTWIKYDDNLPEKDYKFFKEAKQRAKDAGLAVKEEQPRGLKNAFSDKYQKIDNSNLNKYQKVDNISNNKNTENGVTNMNTNQESQATPKTDATASMGIKDYEGKANINPRVATYLEDMGMKLSKAQYDKIATDYPAGDRSGSASALVGRDMRALQAFKKDYAKDINRTIADHEAAFEDVEGYHDFKGGSITISKKGDYLGNTQHASISFAGKPSEETRALLKKNGFTYSPRYKTWENTEKLGSNKHEKVLQALRDGVTIESTQQATPTAQPTQQAEGKQYHGTGIENKNGRYEVSFNEFPSYKLRTDMKANGFRWDPNAKVWHTTDRDKLDQVMSKHFTERT